MTSIQKQISSHWRPMMQKHKILPTWGNCILLSLPFPFECIDSYRVYYSNFIANSKRCVPLWQSLPSSKKVMLSLLVTAIITRVSAKCTCCRGTLWICLHGDPQLALNEVGSQLEVMYIGLIILLSRGYSQPHPLDINADAGILFLWARNICLLYTTLLCR